MIVGQSQHSARVVCFLGVKIVFLVDGRGVLQNTVCSGTLHSVLYDQSSLVFLLYYVFCFLLQLRRPHRVSQYKFRCVPGLISYHLFV